jgi:HlyD family secretion protein
MKATASPRANCWPAWTPARSEASRVQAQAEVQRARQAMAANEANVQLRQSEKLLASQELKRTRQLSQRGFASGTASRPAASTNSNTSNAAVTAAQAQVNAVKAAIGAAQAQVAQLTSEIEDSSLRAPIDGVIQLRLAEPGEVLGSGGRVFMMIDPSDQYMNLYLPAAVVGKLTVGSRGAYRARCPARSGPARQDFLCRRQVAVHPQRSGNPR